MCQAATDNRNRTSAEIKKIFERGGGKLGSANCVAFQFKQKGVIVVEKTKASEDQIMDIALEAGADDVDVTEDAYEITCSPDVFEGVKNALAEVEIEVASGDLQMIADTDVTLDLGHARRVMRLVDALEEHDDVDAVYSNSDIPDAVMAQLAKE